LPRSLALPNEVARWSMSMLREKLAKIGARIPVVFHFAEVAMSRALFAAILRRIDRLRGPLVAAARPERAMEPPASRGEPCAEGP
jgi:hypothetical protein